MLLPFTLSGVIVAAPAEDRRDPVVAAVKRVMSRLEGEKPSNLWRLGSCIEFRDGLFHVESSWNELVGIRYGKLTIDRGGERMRVHYKIWFTPLFVVVTRGAGGIFGDPAQAAAKLSVSQKLLVPPGASLWLAGGNLVTTPVRFPRFLSCTVEAAGEHRPPGGGHLN